MFVTGHIALSYVAARCAGFGDTEAAFIGVAGGMNDIGVVIDALRRKPYSDAYNATHRFSPLLIACLAGAILTPNTAAGLVAAWMVGAWSLHIFIDNFWHRSDGKWYAWGAPLDISLHALWFLLFKDEVRQWIGDLLSVL